MKPAQWADNYWFLQANYFLSRIWDEIRWDVTCGLSYFSITVFEILEKCAKNSKNVFFSTKSLEDFCLEGSSVENLGVFGKKPPNNKSWNHLFEPSTNFPLELGKFWPLWLDLKTSFVQNSNGLDFITDYEAVFDVSSNKYTQSKWSIKYKRSRCPTYPNLTTQ